MTEQTVAPVADQIADREVGTSSLPTSHRWTVMQVHDVTLGQVKALATGGAINLMEAPPLSVSVACWVCGRGYEDGAGSEQCPGTWQGPT